MNRLPDLTKSSLSEQNIASVDRSYEEQEPLESDPLSQPVTICLVNFRESPEYYHEVLIIGIFCYGQSSDEAFREHVSNIVEIKYANKIGRTNLTSSEILEIAQYDLIPSLYLFAMQELIFQDGFISRKLREN